LAYTKAGISIVPVTPNGASALDGSKSLPFDCSEYVWQRIATTEELQEWFAGSQFGLAAVHGPISGGLECLDLTYTAVVKLFRELVTLQGGADLLKKLPTAGSTVGGRTRLYYRCPNPTRGYRRLAQLELPNEPVAVRLQMLAFVHGEGSWTELSGLPALGELDDVYEWVNLDLTQAPSITEDERQLLLESASCLNAWVNPSDIYAPAITDGFDTRATWEQILIPLGWRKIKDFGEVSLWHTPEKSKPGYCAVSGIGFDRDLLYLVRTGKAYTKFGAFASFYFTGDVEGARSVQLPPAPRSRWETPIGTRYLTAIKQAQPPVSCIMPTTGDRRRFLPQAIRCFQHQTYPNLELVIVCDGEDDLFDLIPRDDGRIRYFYLGAERYTLGTKRNLACERAMGDLIAHFDDDDWSHPDRLGFQVGALLAEGAEFCGLSQLLFFEIDTGEVWLCRPPALLHSTLFQFLPLGATYLYRRCYWSSSPFPDVVIDEDIAFTSAEGRQDRSILVSDCYLYVAMIHDSNTSVYFKDKQSTYWSLWPGDLREVMGTDLDFYWSLAQVENDRSPAGGQRGSSTRQKRASQSRVRRKYGAAAGAFEG
jgi:hypothetical protein